MTKYNDFYYDNPAEPEDEEEYTPDPKFLQCKTDIVKFFKRKLKPYYIRQLQVSFEKDYYHWITANAIGSLIKDKFFTKFEAPLKYGNPAIFIVPTSTATPERQPIILKHIDSRRKIIELFSTPSNTRMVGKHLQYLVKNELRANGFNIISENSSEFDNKKWTETGHDLDFIASHQKGFSIGVEVKNTLPYIPKKEFETKLKICDFLGLKPLFAVRWMPKTYIYETYHNHGGFAWLFEYQAYPLGFEALCQQINKTFGFPVKVMPELPADVQTRFSNWVKKQKI